MLLLKGSNVDCRQSLSGYHSRANCVRLQVPVEASNTDHNVYWKNTEGLLVNVDDVLRSTTYTVILDLCHWGPNGFVEIDNGTKRWADFSWNDFIGHWIFLAQRYKNNPRVILQNANEVGMSYSDADQFNSRFVKEMRKAGFNNILMISPPYALPSNLDTMRYWGDTKTWIDIHVYDPLHCTDEHMFPPSNPLLSRFQ